MAHAQEVGFGSIMERGRIAAEGLPNGLVYAGFSLGVMPAQMLAQSRRSLPSYDEGATRLLTDRVLSFLAGVG